MTFSIIGSFQSALELRYNTVKSARTNKFYFFLFRPLISHLAPCGSHRTYAVLLCRPSLISIYIITLSRNREGFGTGITMSLFRVTMASFPFRQWKFTTTFLILVVIGVAVARHLSGLSFKSSGLPLSLASETLDFEAAGNETLGFQKIIFLNLPSRHDLSDAMALQADLSGLQWDVEDSVLADSIDDGKTGYPPSSNQYGTLPTDRGHRAQWACARSHANVWKLILKEGWENALILEGDAAFGIDIRKQSERMAKALNKLSGDRALGLNATKSHPWGSSWDMIYFGACGEGNDFSDIFNVYEDPGSVSFRYDFSLVESFDIGVGKRTIRKSGTPGCTTGYAISRRGARRMLVRQAIDSDMPIDIMIQSEIGKGNIESFTVWPPIMVQWIYKRGLGGSVRDSDIYNGEGESSYDETVWADVHETRNVWSVDDVRSRFPVYKWGLAEVGKL